MLSRSEGKKAAATAAADSDVEDTASEADEPAPTSDVEMPDAVDDNEGSDDDKEDKKPEESKKKKSNGKEKAKSTAKSKGKSKGKGKGGVMMPDEWPWEDAKKIFETPDVLPADEVEVSSCRSTEDFCLIVLVAGVEQPRCRWFGPILSNRKRIQASFSIGVFFQVVTDY
jgi:hypothetical protein